MFAPMTKLRAFLRDIGNVLAIGPRSDLRERVRRVRRSHDDREAQAGDIGHMSVAICAGRWNERAGSPQPHPRG